jgi:hypothetical protein
MDKKILTIMVALLVVAVLVVAFVMIASGGLQRAGGFTTLFDKMEYSGDATYHQQLACPGSWDEGDKKTVSDRIVDMAYERGTIGSTTVYVTTLWFNYMGNKWDDPDRGTSFYIPTSYAGWVLVNHGLFSIEVSTATNLSAKYDIGDVISVHSTLETSHDILSFGGWVVANTI